MAATLGRAVVQPPREGCFDPVITIDIPELRIEEKSAADAQQDQKAPSGHSVNIDVISTALFHTFIQKNLGASLLAMAEFQSPQG
jgi:hypothetical protein